MNKSDIKFGEHWKAYKEFLEKRGRRPSLITDSALYRWYNRNRVRYQKGLLSPERSKMMAQLLSDAETFNESITKGKAAAENKKTQSLEKEDKSSSQENESSESQEIKGSKSQEAKSRRSQDTKWEEQYNTYMDSLIKNHQRPSKYDAKYAVVYRWFRHNNKLYKHGLLKPERIEKFEKLLEMAEKYKRVNQYIYVDWTEQS